MKWWWIISFVSIAVIIVIIIFIIFLIKKQKQTKITKLTNNLNNYCANLQLATLPVKELPVASDKISEDIYYSCKAVSGEYHNNRDISGKNLPIKINSKVKINKHVFLRYKIKDVSFIKPSHFIPLNQVDLLVSQQNVYFIDAFELQTIAMSKITNIIIFWEKNNHIKDKQKYCGVELVFDKNHLFFLFPKYEQALIFVSHILLLVTR